MKKSLAHLSKQRQRELQEIVQHILSKLPDTQMIILYGSYARGDYVEYDEREEFGVRTFFMSDYDILVATNNVGYMSTSIILSNIEAKQAARSCRRTPIQFIHDDIAKLNKDLSDGRYFYTEVKRDGIMLYNSGNFKLERRRKLRFNEIKAQAQEYYEEKLKEARFFFDDALTNSEKGRYKRASFHLHQATENAFKAVRLAYTLDSGKNHDLAKLLGLIKGYAPEEYFKLFPRQTKEEKRLFELLRVAYIEARYNPDFVVTKEDIDILMPIIEQLLELTKQLCEERIKEYDGMQ